MSRYNDDDEPVKYQPRGIGFFGLLAIVFITLKLTGVITWSWWLVLGPLWMPIALILTILGALLYNKGNY